MGIFQEYLDSKGKLKDAKVSVSGDLTDPENPPNTPEGSKKPYKSDGKKLKTNSEKGFGDQGDDDLKYKPDVQNFDGKEPAKIPTAEQVELCGIMADAIQKDPSVVEQLICQLRRKGMMGMLVAEMCQYKETFSHLVEVMGHETYGPVACKKLAKAFNEEVAPPFADVNDEDLDDDEDKPEDEPHDGPENQDAEGEPLMNGVNKKALDNFKKAMAKT